MILSISDDDEDCYNVPAQKPCTCCFCGLCGYSCTPKRKKGWIALGLVAAGVFSAFLGNLVNAMVPDPEGAHGESLYSFLISYVQCFSVISLVDMVRMQSYIGMSPSWELYWFLAECSVSIIIEIICAIAVLITFFCNGVMATDIAPTILAVIAASFCGSAVVIIYFLSVRVLQGIKRKPQTNASLQSSRTKILLCISLAASLIATFLLLTSIFSSDWAYVYEDTDIIKRYGVRPNQGKDSFWYTIIIYSVYMCFPLCITVTRDVVVMIVRNKGEELDPFGETLITRSWAFNSINFVLLFETYFVFSYNYRTLAKTNPPQMVFLGFAYYLAVVASSFIFASGLILSFLLFRYRTI
ncbi:unnamed protein product [Caenorhabditis auriculariae]|uniref:Uncharacterized protein n=1 Tax=Caenorhabditis auriculariae TaxID=2777116 RepID=A0A8S1H8V7_9PELO|nr:unnamed protein product [Caenorhabditis auriculariae]